MKTLPLVLMAFMAASALPAQEDLGVLLNRARQARNAAQWEAALKAYDAMLAIVDTHETALFERAQALGWAGRHGESIQAWRRFRAAYPARAGEADQNLARVAAWGRQFDVALATLDPYVKRRERQAVLDAATYLGWAGRLSESLVLSESWLKDHPDDMDALLIQGRCASWAGKIPESKAAYGRLLALKPGHGDALAGLARVSIWSGDPAEARRCVDQLTVESLQAPEQQVLLAQVELAEGHRRRAVGRLRPLAEKEGPMRKDALDLLRAAATAQGPSLEISHGRTDTSEDLVMEDSAATLRLPLWDGSASLGGARHRVSFLGRDTTVKEVNGGLAYPVGPVRLFAQVQRLDGIGTEPASAHQVGLGWRAYRGVEFSLSHGLSWAAFTPRALDLRVGIWATEGALTLTSPHQVLRLSGGSADTSAGNSRRTWLATYDWRWRFGPTTLTTGVLTRGLGYDRSLDLGFFNPERYRFHALTLGVGHEQGGFSGNLGIRGGRQVVNDQPWKGAWGYDGDLSWRPAGTSFVIFAAASYSSAGIPVTNPAAANEYWERSWRVGLRLTAPWR